MENLGVLEKKIGLSFRKKALLIEAMTHRSFPSANRATGSPHNERLEFLGSYILGLAVRDSLLRVFPKREVGDITVIANGFASEEMLAEIARELDLFSFLSIQRGAGNERPGEIGAYKALVGAIHTDQGYAAARSFITQTLLAPRLKRLEEILSRDPKTHLQEKSQHFLSILPRYKVLGENGPAHTRTFEVGVFLRGQLVARGEGRSKKEAEMMAAQNALQVQKWI